MTPNSPVPLASEKIIVAAPMSLAGSAARIWRLTKWRREPWARAVLIPVAVILIVVVWALVIAWYAVFSLFLVPYRLVRRGQRKRRREALQHRELLGAIERNRPEGP